MVAIPPSTREKIEALLQRFVDATAPDVEAVTLSYKDGIPIAWKSPAELDVRLLAALGVALRGAIERLFQRLEGGEFKIGVLRGDKKDVVLVTGGELTMIALTKKEANVGLIMLEIRDTLNQVEELLGKA